MRILPGFTEAQSTNLVHQVAEMAATAATIAARDRDVVRIPRRTSAQGNVPSTGMAGAGGAQTVAGSSTIRTTNAARPPVPESGGFDTNGLAAQHAAEAEHGGHVAPNWSRLKSSVILMCATALYAVIAEILVDSVDFVLDGFAIDQKFLGITLFALVPNTTEFLVSPPPFVPFILLRSSLILSCLLRLPSC
jgi:Ca2+:H+ antiporter